MRRRGERGEGRINLMCLIVASFAKFCNSNSVNSLNDRDVALQCSEKYYEGCQN
jgi:hypothetical protein